LFSLHLPALTFYHSIPKPHPANPFLFCTLSLCSAIPLSFTPPYLAPSTPRLLFMSYRLLCKASSILTEPPPCAPTLPHWFIKALRVWTHTRRWMASCSVSDLVAWNHTLMQSVVYLFASFSSRDDYLNFKQNWVIWHTLLLVMNTWIGSNIKEEIEQILFGPRNLKD